MSELRGVCIGGGYFSQFHLDAWNRIPGVQIAGLCDLNLEVAERRARAVGIEHFGVNASEMLDQLQPDFVDIITPPDTHLSLVQIAADRAIPIICQKPLAPTAEETLELLQYCADQDVRLMVHENFRFQPWHREIRNLLEVGVIGDRLHSLTFYSRFGDGWGEDAYLERQPGFREMPRFLVQETGIHIIDTFRFLAGEIHGVYALLRQLNPAIVGEDTGLIIFEFTSGAVGIWDANRFNESTADDPRYTFGELTVEGNGGTLRLYPTGRLTVQPLGEKEQEHVYHHSREGFAGDCVLATQQHFIDAMRNDAPFETSGTDYIRNVVVQEAVYRSAEDRQPVRGFYRLPQERSQL